MRVLYRIHLVLGIVVSVPLLGWALSGLLYALPGEVSGGATYAAIDPARIKLMPAEALARANAFAERPLPITALTLEQVDDRLTYQAIGGLGADSLMINAETGAVSLTAPPSAKTRFFRQAHFWFFAGRWQVPILITMAALATISILSGLTLAGALWVRWLRRAAPGDR